MEPAAPLPLPESLAGVSAKTQVADIVNAVRGSRAGRRPRHAGRLSERSAARHAQVLDNTAASLDAYHRHVRVCAACVLAGRRSGSLRLR
jgi:hypothetical protein